MNSPRPPIGNETEDSAEALAQADLIAYSEILSSELGFDAKMLEDFVDPGKAMGIENSKYYKAPPASRGAQNLESLLLISGYPIKPKYTHLHGRKNGRNRELYANSERLMSGLNKTVGADSTYGMVFTEAAQANADYAIHLASNPLSFLIKSPKLLDREALTADVTAHVAQVEVMLTLNRVLEAVSTIGSRRASVRIGQVFRDGIQDTKVPDPVQTLQLVKQAIEVLEQLLASEQNRNAATLYSGMITNLRSNLAYIEKTRVFGRVADQTVIVEEPLSDESQSVEAEIEIVEVSESPNTTQEELVVEVEHSAETPIDVLNTIELLSGEVDKHNRYWFDIGRKWRQNGFADLMSQIVHAKNLFEKVQAPLIIGFMARINESAIINVENAITELAKAEQNGADLVARRLKFISENSQYTEVKDFAKKTFMINLSTQAANVREKWTKLSSLVRQEWPSHDGADAAQRIQNVLFSSTSRTDTSAIELSDQVEINEMSASDPHQGIDTGEIDVLRELIGQLDEIILPPGMTEQHLIQQLRELGVERPDEINWEKFKDLIEITKEFGGKVYRSKMRRQGESEDYGEVYYVSVFDLYGNRFAVAESPMVDNATYVIDETHTPGSWIEMLTMAKSQVRELGGRQIIHSAASPYGPLHREKIVKYIFDVSAEQ